jgi:Protein of unknown function (DUF3572)
MIKMHSGPMPLSQETAELLALQALAAIVADDVLRDRFLALTGLTGQDMRALAGDSSFLGAILGFLTGHEPSLVKIASNIGCPPDQLAQAAHLLAAHEPDFQG